MSSSTDKKKRTSTLYKRKDERDKSELDELQRKLKVLEKKFNQKSSKTDNSNRNPDNAVRMQRQQIDKLKKVTDRNKEELELETRQAKQANDTSASLQIAKLTDQADYYSRRIRAEKKRISTLEDNIVSVQKQIYDKRITMSKLRFDSAKSTSASIQKEIRTLENKLDNALIKFNEALAGNKKLTNQIKNLKRERQTFQRVYRRLHRELAAKQEKMNKIIEVTEAAAYARDDAETQMGLLKQQADREQQQFQEQWSQLGDELAKDASASGYQNRAVDGDEAVHMADERKLKRRLDQGKETIQKDEDRIKQSHEEVQRYEEAFAKIIKATQIRDIDELVDAFINAEDANFSLFNYVNVLSSQIDNYKDQIGKVSEELEKYKGKGLNKSDEKKDMLSGLAGQIEVCEKKSERFEAEYENSMKSVVALKATVQGVFHKIGCKDSGLLGNAGVTENNMMQYLGLIEERASELVAVFEQMQREQAQDNLSHGANELDTDPDANDTMAVDAKAAEPESEPAVVEETAPAAEPVAEPAAEPAAAEPVAEPVAADAGKTEVNSVAPVAE